MGNAIIDSALGRYEVLHLYRRRTDCVYTLAFDLSDPAVIRFVEFFEYLPRPGDPGREYAYSVVIPATELDALVRCLDAVAREATGGPPPQPPGIPVDDTPAEPRAAALVRAGRALVEADRFADEPTLAGNVTRMGRWLDAAGLPYERTSWSWVNSE